jgi:hypothetical protein
MLVAGFVVLVYKQAGYRLCEREQQSWLAAARGSSLRVTSADQQFWCAVAGV